MKTLTDYQSDTVQAIKDALAKHKSTIAVLATGLGKSVVCSKVASEFPGTVLILAHRIELVDQMAAHIATELGYDPEIEQGDRVANEYSLMERGKVVVASVQTMITPRRMKRYSKHPFALCIVDECHRATSASYVKLIDAYRQVNPDCKLLGVTATPNRTDGTAMGLVFDSVAIERGIVWGIANGWLVDIRQKFAIVENLDLSKVKSAYNEFGERDFDRKQLEELLTQEGPLHAMSRPVLDCTQNGEQALIFASSVNHAHLWERVLNHYRPDCAKTIDGNTPKDEREYAVNLYKEKRLQFLLNFNIFTEGFDAPATEFVVMGRPTKSQLVYTQALGRCTRPLPGLVYGLATAEERKDAIAGSAKPFATVLDFVGATRLAGVVTATDVLGGNYDVDMRAAANEITGANEGSEGHVLDALEKAKACLMLEAEEDKRKEARDAIARTKVNYILEDVKGFGSPTRPALELGRGDVSDKTVESLLKMGVKYEVAIGYSQKQAGAVLKSMRDKQPSMKQIKWLKWKGFNPAEYNFWSAQAKITELNSNGN